MDKRPAGFLRPARQRDRAGPAVPAGSSKSMPCRYAADSWLATSPGFRLIRAPTATACSRRGSPARLSSHSVGRRHRARPHVIRPSRAHWRSWSLDAPRATNSAAVATLSLRKNTDSILSVTITDGAIPRPPRHIPRFGSIVVSDFRPFVPPKVSKSLRERRARQRWRRASRGEGWLVAGGVAGAWPEARCREWCGVVSVSALRRSGRTLTKPRTCHGPRKIAADSVVSSPRASIRRRVLGRP